MDVFFNKRKYDNFQELIEGLCSVMVRYANSVEDTKFKSDVMPVVKHGVCGTFGEAAHPADPVEIGEKTTTVSGYHLTLATFDPSVIDLTNPDASRQTNKSYCPWLTVKKSTLDGAGNGLFAARTFKKVRKSQCMLQKLPGTRNNWPQIMDWRSRLV